MGSDALGRSSAYPLEKLFGFLAGRVIGSQTGLQVAFEESSCLIEIPVVFDIGACFHERDARFFRRECPRLRE